MKFKALLFVLVAPMLLVQYGCKKDCEKPAACELEPDPGICEAYMPRWYYDADAGRCKEFIYGGCGGTVPFETKEECKACQCK